MIRSGLINMIREKIFEILQSKGYKGGMSILKDYVHQYRSAKSSPSVMSYETLPGKQSQMYWGITQYVDERGIVQDPG